LAKNLKLTIKNTQIAEAVNLNSLKDKLAKKAQVSEESKTEAPKADKVEKAEANKPKAKSTKPAKTEASKAEPAEVLKEVEAPKIKARSRSAFAEPAPGETRPKTAADELPSFSSVAEEKEPVLEEESSEEEPLFNSRRKTSEELRKEIFAEELRAQEKEQTAPAVNPLMNEMPVDLTSTKEIHQPEPLPTPIIPPKPKPQRQPSGMLSLPKPPAPRSANPYAKDYVTPAQKLGPTGKHVNDLIPPKPAPAPAPVRENAAPNSAAGKTSPAATEEERKAKFKNKPREETVGTPPADDKRGPAGQKTAKFKEFKDIKPAKRQEQSRFDGRDRQGLRDGEEDQHWRKKRAKQARYVEDVTIRPTSLKVRIPIAIKDLASEMKLKASQLITKLFLQGVVVTLNDILEDETTIQLLGHEFGCEITIDSSEEERIRITDKSIKEEVQAADPAVLKTRPPVVAFMGHVDHGKTSLIDAIRQSNRAAGEAGAITQHIGAFRCSTPVGDIAILDTPGHEAFSAMRARGADATDIVVLVVAGDEGMRQQTIEALMHAKAANVTIVVAINKSDKPNFNVENVYRQLSENELLPEAWGGQTITINCSAVTGEGIPQLLEMLALQAEILELKADPTCRARGTVLESEMHKGMGSIATVLVQNGTLNLGDALVFGQHWGRVKTMRNEYREELQKAGPSTPVEITGMSGLPEAGQEFIVVKNEREAREIAEARMLGMRQINLLQAKKFTMENLFQQAAESNKKILNLILRADVQGSLEALKAALMKIESTKAELNIIFTGVGEVSESDVQLAAASKAMIIGFHTQIESHAEAIVKQLGIQVKLHNIIYHAVDDVKLLMSGLLDKIAQETERGKADVLATFKSSQHGVIAGCIVTEGSIHRNHSVRIKRNKEVIWKGSISSLKRVKEDVREVNKGLECGIVLNGFNDAKEGDLIEAYEVTYITQEL
jgi:translation initiation factor IF-2